MTACLLLRCQYRTAGEICSTCRETCQGRGLARCKWPVLIFAVGVECGENGGEPPGGSGGEPGENRGRPKEPGENRGHFGKRTGGEPGLLVLIYKQYRGRNGGFGTKTGGEPGGRNFLRNKRLNSGSENQRAGPPVKICMSVEA